jgi:hypothetical protein
LLSSKHVIKHSLLRFGVVELTALQECQFSQCLTELWRWLRSGYFLQLFYEFAVVVDAEMRMAPRTIIASRLASRMMLVVLVVLAVGEGVAWQRLLWDMIQSDSLGNVRLLALARIFRDCLRYDLFLLGPLGRCPGLDSD